MIVTVTAGQSVVKCNVVVGGGVEAAESVSSIDTVSAPGLSVWSLVSSALQTVFTRVSLYDHHQ